jgi:purine-nucleoside phosphorylase
MDLQQQGFHKDSQAMTTSYLQRVQDSVAFLQDWAGPSFGPQAVLVLGSGLSGVVNEAQILKRVPFGQIPGFRAAAVSGHAGDLVLFQVGNHRVVALRGRIHAYEGHDAGDVTHGVRTVISWGAKVALITNAAGCLVADWQIGRLMVLSDHVNATGLNPLVSPFGDGFGARFVDLSCAYDKTLAQRACSVLAQHGEAFYQGIYHGVLGPSYETPAEVRMFRQLGSHAVGMSTVLETIAARQLGARVLGVSCLTNFAAGLMPGTLDHNEVLEQGRSVQTRVAKLLPDLLMECLRGQ